MIDIHSHILPKIDDGARTTEEAFIMLEEAYRRGFTDIIATPHYMPGVYTCNKLQIEKLINDLQKELYKKNINLKIYIGTECYIAENLDTLIKENIISTLNNSRYILFELPINTKVIFLDYIIDNLKQMELVPIIAHPERYEYIQQDPNILMDLINKGVLCQLNYGSLIGVHGRKAKDVSEILLKHNMVHFLATDCHAQRDLYDVIHEILDGLAQVISKEDIDNLININPKCVLENKDVYIKAPIFYNKKKFGLF